MPSAEHQQRVAMPIAASGPGGVGALVAAARRDLLIDGMWAPARAGGTIATINPATEQMLGEVALADAGDVDLAVRAARKAFDAGVWSGMAPGERARLLWRIAELIDRDVELLAMLIVVDNGKPLAEARGEAASAAEIFRYYSGWPTKLFGETNPANPGMISMTVREPLGVCALIVPWNGTVVSPAWKIAPALACGNTMVLKASEVTPLAALRLGDILMEAGVPSGVVNIIVGTGTGAGSALTSHPLVDKISFTGSTAVGMEIQRVAAGTMKRVSLELGGKSACVVFDDADLDNAVTALAAGIFKNQGQLCIAASRMFVHERVYDAFADRLSRLAGSIRLGDPLDPETTMGPLVSKIQYDRVMGYIAVGKQEGGDVRAGGNRGVQAAGYFVQPTVFAGMDNGMRVAREEIFGPVACLIPFSDEDDVVRQANDTTYGLAAGVFTRDLARAHRVSRRLKAGSIWVNTYNAVSPMAPFGGFKQSGIGRELGRYALDAYTEIKTIAIKL
jgi:acyl-CoA reductase-like NAD-dependent aldehyde dehydrogenase